jgi:hypothetical protein
MADNYFFLSTSPLIMSSLETIGLFGICGASAWRERFMAEYAALGAPFFNPQVESWTPERALEEARHLANDAVVLFPVTAETFAVGSQAETGFSVRNALRVDAARFVVLFIAPDVTPALYAENAQAAVPWGDAQRHEACQRLSCTRLARFPPRKSLLRLKQKAFEINQTEAKTSEAGAPDCANCAAIPRGLRTGLSPKSTRGSLRREHVDGVLVLLVIGLFDEAEGAVYVVPGKTVQ